MQKDYKGECQRWSQENRPAITTLKDKLIAIAGSRISPQPCPFISTIASDGELIELPVLHRRMGGNHCHDNVAWLWNQRNKRFKLLLAGGLPILKAIATGYALNEDGMWRPHSWGVTATHIVETTVSRLQYFGIVLSAEVADAF
jgi:hypothetical protein